jgi:hypothetical protein
MTFNQLKKEAKRLGIGFHPRTKKDELIKLIEDHVPTEPEVEPDPLYVEPETDPVEVILEDKKGTAVMKDGSQYCHGSFTWKSPEDFTVDNRYSDDYLGV